MRRARALQDARDPVVVRPSRAREYTRVARAQPERRRRYITRRAADEEHGRTAEAHGHERPRLVDLGIVDVAAHRISRPVIINDGRLGGHRHADRRAEAVAHGREVPGHGLGVVARVASVRPVVVVAERRPPQVLGRRGRPRGRGQAVAPGQPRQVRLRRRPVVRAVAAVREPALHVWCNSVRQNKQARPGRELVGAPRAPYGARVDGGVRAVSHI